MCQNCETIQEGIRFKIKRTEEIINNWFDLETRLILCRPNKLGESTFFYINSSLPSYYVIMLRAVHKKEYWKLKNKIITYKPLKMRNDFSLRPNIVYFIILLIFSRLVMYVSFDTLIYMNTYTIIKLWVVHC